MINFLNGHICRKLITVVMLLMTCFILTSFISPPTEEQQRIKKLAEDAIIQADQTHQNNFVPKQQAEVNQLGQKPVGEIQRNLLYMLELPVFDGTKWIKLTEKDLNRLSTENLLDYVKKTAAIINEHYAEIDGLFNQILGIQPPKNKDKFINKALEGSDGPAKFIVNRYNSQHGTFPKKEELDNFFKALRALEERRERELGEPHIKNFKNDFERLVDMAVKTRKCIDCANVAIDTAYGKK